MAEAKAFKIMPHCTKDTIQYEMDELIRCKDCKYGDAVKAVKNAKGEPMVKCVGERCLKEPDWYCADGERG